MDFEAQKNNFSQGSKFNLFDADGKVSVSIDPGTSFKISI